MCTGTKYNLIGDVDILFDGIITQYIYLCIHQAWSVRCNHRSGLQNDKETGYFLS